MKKYIDLQTEEEASKWLSEMKALLKTPSQHLDVTTFYRDHLDDWNGFETWQREELMESYEAQLNRLAADSTTYGNFSVTPDELRNLSDDALDDFSFFAQIHVPSAVVHTRCVEEGIAGDKMATKAMQITKDALELHKTLTKIANLGT